MKTTDLRTADETFTNEVLIRQVATVLLTGVSVADCAKQLNIKPSAVRKIAASTKYKELVADTAESELGPALAKAKAQLAKLTTKAVAAIERALEVGSSTRDALQAATIVLKSVGLHEDEKQQQDMVLNIVMPDGQAPLTIDVPNEATNEET